MIVVIVFLFSILLISIFILLFSFFFFLFTVNAICSSFSSFLRWELRSWIWELSSLLIEAFSVINFLLSTVFLFFFFWLCWVFVAAHRLSLVVASGGYSSLRCTGFSLRWLLLLRSMGTRHVGFSSCGAWAQWLWCMGLVAPRHVGSSWTRAQTRVPSIGRWILNDHTTREALYWVLF